MSIRFDYKANVTILQLQRGDVFINKFNFQKLDDLKGDMSYLELSRKTGIQNQTIHNWKNGTYQPTVKSIMILSDFFGVGIDYWYTE